MVTQKMTIRLDESELPEIRMVSGDVGREIQIEVYVREDSTNPIDLETYSAEITLIKPDNTFIMDNFTVDKYELPENAGAVSGYGYYQIKIFTAGSHQIYTGQGRFLVDDMILSDDVIESSSIAFGDRFPEDFATKTWVDDEIKAAGIGTYVAGNPAGEETMPPLVRLQINDDIYPISHKIEEMEDADITSPAAGDVLTYDADNQKWKNEPIDIPDATVTKTATGNPVEFSDGAYAPLVKCVTAITGSQDLHGYDKPWVGGAGKNKCAPYLLNDTSQNGIVVNVQKDNAGNIIGYSVPMNTASAYTNIVFGVFTPSADGIYIVSGAIFENASNDAKTFLWDETAQVNVIQTIQSDNISVSLTSQHLYMFAMIIRQGFTVPASTLRPMIRLATVADSTFEPYSNICPITAYTEGEIEVSDGNGNVTTHTTTYPSAIYRGSEDCVNGTATTEWGVIASYAGETLPGEWISDRDEYAPGTTPTTGAQVAYALATPTTAPIVVSNYPIKSLSGYNHIESSTGDMEVEYIAQTYDAIMEATKLDNMKVYSTAEQIVGKWVDGSDVKEKTYIYTGTGVANPFTTTIDFTGKSIIEVIQHYVKFTYGGGTVGYCAGSALVNNNSNLMNVAYDDNTPPTVRVTCYIGSGTETYEVAFTIRYI